MLGLKTRVERLIKSPRFSLSDLFVIVFGVAVAMGVRRIKPVNAAEQPFQVFNSLDLSFWQDGAFAAVIAWVSLGLITQSRDLWTAFHQRDDLSDEVRTSYRFALFWRLATVMILVGSLIYVCLLATGILVLDDWDWADFIWPFHPTGSLQDALVTLLVVVSLWSAPYSVVTSNSWQSRGVHWIGCVGMIVIAAIVAIEFNLLPFLVTVAVSGIEMSGPPLRHEVLGVSNNLPERLNHLWLMSVVGAVGVVTAILVLPAWVRALGTQQRRRYVSAAFVVSGSGLGAGYLIWLYCGGLYQALPDHANTLEVMPLNIWISCTLVLVVAVTAVTCRLFQKTGVTRYDQSVEWRRRSAAYYHERVWIPLILIAWFFVQVVAFFFGDIFGLTSLESIQAFLTWPPSSWQTVLFLAATYRLIALARCSDPANGGLPFVRPKYFAMVWLVTLLITILAAGTLVWFSFAAWLSPWYLVAWP
ncbi:MAG: hypothetical protein N2C12_15290 [Planctomycetales bacterium]